MLNLSRETELNKFLPKKTIFDKFNMSSLERERFDLDIKKLVIANEISPTTLRIARGEDVEAIFVLRIQLKSDVYNEKNILLISKLINQKMLFVLEYAGKARLAVFYQKLHQTQWKQLDQLYLDIKGLNLDIIWENFIIQISGLKIERDKTIEEQIKINEIKSKLQQQIESIEKQARLVQQPKKKYDLVERLRKLKEEMGQLNG